MRTNRLRFAAAGALAALVVVQAPGVRAAARSTPPTAITERDFALSNFSAASVNVTNRFQPLVPGTEFTYTGTANRGAGNGAHRVVFTVTEVTKPVNGIRAVALWDRDFQDGRLVEEELAFMAQDDQGNVWSLGEYPEEHDANDVASTPSVWLAGNQGAITGLLMRAQPATGTPSYLQGDAPAIEFLDRAVVFQTDQKVCVPTGCYTGVLVVDEWDPSAQPEDGHQFKYHAPGVGVVQIVGRGGVEQETLQLTGLRTLERVELDAADTRSLQLDARAYQMNPEVWSGTAPATVPAPVAP